MQIAQRDQIRLEILFQDVIKILHRSMMVLVPTAYPELTEADIAALGKVAIVIYGNHAVRAAVGAMRSVFAQIRRAGGIREVDKILPSVKDIIGLQGDDYCGALKLNFWAKEAPMFKVERSRYAESREAGVSGEVVVGIMADL
jgi:hypothetical protein